MTEVVNHDTGEVVETITAGEARRLTTEARNEFEAAGDHHAKGWAKIVEAVTGGGHLALGYRSPGDYLHAEFDGVLSGLDVTARRIAVKTMTSWGLSTRATGAALGVSHPTIQSDQKSGGKPLPPAPQTPEATRPDLVAASGQTSESRSAGLAREDSGDRSASTPPASAPALRPNVVGIDGKTYTRPEPRAPRAAPRRALSDQFFDAAYDLTKVTERIDRLVTDDRFPQNAEKVAAKHRNDLLRAVELLSKALDRFNNN